MATAQTKANRAATTTNPNAERDIMARSLADPVWFVRNILDGDPWSKQEEILQSVADYRRTAVRSCHGVGKTKCASWVMLWFLFTHPDSVVITTAPTFQQVESLLWREIRSAYAGSRIPLGGPATKVLNTEISVGEKWFAIGLSTDKPERFQGFHAESGNILLICDEASGINQQIFDAAEGFLTSQGSRLLLIGNPTQLSGEFYNAFRTTLYHKIHMSAFDSPNIKDGYISRPYLITPEWVDEKRQKWGEENPLWYARVLGEFPEQGDDTLISLADIEAAQARYADQQPGLPSILGVDVARFGTDSTVIMHRQGQKVSLFKQIRKHDTMAVTGAVIDAMRTTRADKCQIDVCGLGAGVYDRLKEQKIACVAMNAGERSENPDMFLNRRAEWYWNLRDAFKNGTIAIPPMDELAAQLAGIKYKFTSKGQVQIESKEDMKSRGVSSPDLADAVCLAWSAREVKKYHIGRA